MMGKAYSVREVYELWRVGTHWSIIIDLADCSIVDLVPGLASYAKAKGLPFVAPQWKDIVAAEKAGRGR